MDPLGITQPVIIPPSQPITLSDNNAPAITLSAPQASAPSAGTDDSAGFDLQAATQRRLQAVQHMAQDVANVYVVSDTKFTIFKDSTGQYITRFTSLRDGKVTYIPEPTLFKLGGSSFGGSATPILKIEA